MFIYTYMLTPIKLCFMHVLNGKQLFMWLASVDGASAGSTSVHKIIFRYLTLHGCNWYPQKPYKLVLDTDICWYANQIICSQFVEGGLSSVLDVLLQHL